jgi:hypothetical protein
MKVLNLLGILLSLILTTACSVKKEDTNSSATNSTQSLSTEELKKLDSDGDTINDYEEKVLGFDRLIGNYPELEVSFLQNFNVKVSYADNSEFILDTNVGRNDPDFEYKTGKLFLRENVLNKAASYARFSEHSWGEIDQKDFSWVKYPELDKYYYHAKAHQFSNNSEKEVKEITIDLENTLKLVENGFFREIKDLEVNFYYYDYRFENYQLLHTEIIDRTFQEGVREDFHVQINNVPHALLKDNYFKKGEFIVSEVKDFFIPKLNMKFSRLKASMEAKTTKLFYITPLKSKMFYVATDENGNSFIEILKRVFDDKFTVESERLIAADQFKNNLGSFRHLEDVRTEDKNGNWFIMTEDNKQHYVKHKFSTGQTITMAYMTGSELSKRTQKKVSLMEKSIDSGNERKQIKLGDITSNSNIKFSIKLLNRHGVVPNVVNKNFRFAPRCSARNCSGCWPIVDGFYDHVSTKEINLPLSTNFFTKEYNQLGLSLHGKETSLKELLENNAVTIKIENGFFNIHLKNPGVISSLSKTEKNTLYLVLNADRSVKRSLGINVTRINSHRCMPRIAGLSWIAYDTSIQFKSPIGAESLELNTWKHRILWDRKDPNTGYVIKLEPIKTFPQMFSVDVISSITNYFN